MSVIDFSSPSYRAQSSDLTIAVSPLGLVELADEEFEVHGPRLNRYAQNWAFYLGRHWGYQAPLGEPQITFNYCQAMSDYTTNFCFGRGVTYQVPKENEAVIPPVLDRIWEVDNERDRLHWEIGQTGSVCGDVFVKVAYEDEWTDTAGNKHPGRCRIIPLNPVNCFPEWAPHDRNRLLRFKLKYRFWACVDTTTEALTRRGWMRYDELQEDDELLTLDPDTDEIRWEPLEAVNVADYPGHLVAWDRIDAVTTPNHRWLTESLHGRDHTARYVRQIARTELPIDDDPSISSLRAGSRIVVGGGTPLAFSTVAKWSDELVETVAWYVCDGSDHRNQTGFNSIHLSGKKPHKVSAWRRLAAWWTEQGATFREGTVTASGQTPFYLGKNVAAVLQAVAPEKQITADFLCSLTYAQAVLFHNTLIAGDGYTRNVSVRWTQIDAGRKDAYQMLCAMLGIRTAISADGEKVQEYVSRWVGTRESSKSARRVWADDGKIWCPSVRSGIWFARRNGNTYWTGNTTLEGTRSLYTYTELITDSSVSEFINDELLDERPNPLGEIPIAWTPNLLIAGSPWGQSDIANIIALNRQYNETATALADIINYHAEPTTIITGAKASNLVKGASKTWSGLPADAKVYNLEIEGDAPLMQAFLDRLKQAMHEMTGIPVTALGQEQAVSNTSGVALQIQYQPMMQRFRQKSILYGSLYERINDLALKTLAWKEPEVFAYDPRVAPPLREGQLPILDRRDPATYRTKAHFSSPLPIDKLIKINEIISLMQLGLESKRGALQELGEEHPDEKLEELQNELMDDAKRQGALDLLNAKLADVISLTTITGSQALGADGTSQSGGVTSAGGPNVNSAAQPQRPPSQKPPLPGVGVNDIDDLYNQLTTLAQGTKLPQTRTPNNSDAD